MSEASDSGVVLVYACLFCIALPGSLLFAWWLHWYSYRGPGAKKVVQRYKHVIMTGLDDPDIRAKIREIVWEEEADIGEKPKRKAKQS